MRRKATLVRQWEVLRELSASVRGLRASDLASRVGTSLATLYRDLDVLRGAGFPIVSVDEDGARWRMLRNGAVVSRSLGREEWTALMLAGQTLDALRGTTYHQAIFALLSKKPDNDVAAPTVRRRPSPHDEKALRTIEQAIQHRVRVELTYRAAKRGGKAETYLVEPLHLLLIDGDLYLACFALERDDKRLFKVARIVAAKYTKQPAVPHPELPVEVFVSRAVKAWSAPPIDVAVRLDPHVAWRAAEYPLATTQELVPQADGGAIVRATVAGIVEAARYVIAFGDQAEALEPPELRDAVRSELERAFGRYDEGGSAAGTIAAGRGDQRKPPAKARSKTKRREQHAPTA